MLYFAVLLLLLLLPLLPLLLLLLLPLLRLLLLRRLLLRRLLLLQVGANECLFRFEFRQRPGALFAFVSDLCRDRLWNVTLWHYRDHGADVGRMLVGLQVSRAR